MPRIELKDRESWIVALIHMNGMIGQVLSILESVIKERSSKDPRPADLLACLDLRKSINPEWPAETLPRLIEAAKARGCWVEMNAELSTHRGERWVIESGLASACKSIELCSEAWALERDFKKAQSQGRLALAMLCAGELSGLWGNEPIYMKGGIATAESNEARKALPHVFKLWLEYKESRYCKTLYKNRTAFDRYCEQSFGPTQLTVQKWRTTWERGGAETLEEALTLTSSEHRKARKSEPAS